MSARFACLSVVALALVGLVAVGSAVAGKHTRLAKLLARHDPGKRVRGNTVIGTGASEDLYAVPGRVNFVIALGNGETIHGAGDGDELGALGRHVKIVAPRSGHALIEGGPESTIVIGGKGHDLVVEHKAGATIEVLSPGNKVMATGLHDRVVCGPRAHDETITLGRTDTVSPRCRGHHDSIKHSPTPHAAAVRKPSARGSQTLACVLGTGSGTDADPCIRPCSTGTQGIHCDVTFYPRTLGPGLWANEYVPAYECPSSQPWLMNVNYAPVATTLSNGVEVLGLGPVGVIIEGAGYSFGRDIGGIPYAAGIRTGPFWSSATNWTLGYASYTVVLHCTDARSEGYQLSTGG